MGTEKQGMKGKVGCEGVGNDDSESKKKENIKI